MSDDELQEAISSAPVVFFSSSTCGYCDQAEATLEQAGIAFTKLPIAKFKSALKSRTGKTSAPSVWIHGTYVGGCNDGTESWHGVRPMVRSGKFQEMVSKM
jgi:glutaredoxin